MKTFFTCKKLSSCSAHRIAARIISIMILAFLWSAKGEAKVADVDPADWAEYGQTAVIGGLGSVDTDLGTDGVTYTVETARGLAWIAWVTNEGKTKASIVGETHSAYYPSAAGFEGSTVILNDGISLAKPDGFADSFDANWMPIGTTDVNAFKGTFDGNYNTITGMTIEGAVSVSYIGLFGCLDNATVKNLTVGGVIALTSSSNTLNIGGIAGVIRNTKIINCHNECEISGENSDQSIRAGGIAGFNYSSSSSIYASSNSGNINITGAKCDAGGIIATLNANAEVASCFNSGSITTQSYGDAGGIIGNTNANSEVSNCYSTGDVVVNSSSISEDVHCGGIAGSILNGTITSCYATGSISAEHKGTNCYAGGIAGNSTGTGTSNISNCLALNTGNVKALGSAANKSAKRILGNGSATLTDNYASTKIELQVGDDGTLAVPTEDIATNLKNGENVYLDDVATAIGSWAGMLHTLAFTAIETGTGGKLPRLREVYFDTNDEPTGTFYGSVISGQPDASLKTTEYLENKPVEPLELPAGGAATIYITYSGGEWSSRKGSDASVPFNGIVKMASSGRFTGNLFIEDVTGNPTLTFEEVSLGSVDIKSGCELTIHTTQAKMSIEEATLLNSGTLTLTGEGMDIKNRTTAFCIMSTGTLTITDPATTAITLQSNLGAIYNTGTLTNAWIEWQFVAAPASIAFTDTDETPQAGQECNFKTHAAPVTAGKSYRLWKMSASPSPQQGKAAGGKSVMFFDAPAENGVAVFTEVTNAVTVTIPKPKDGGSVSVFCNDRPLANLDYVPYGAELICKYNAVSGYEIDTYNANPSSGIPASVLSGSYTVPGGAAFILFTATFKVNPDAPFTEKEAVTTKPSDPVTDPVVVIPSDQMQQPPVSDPTSTIKLLTGDLEETNKAAVKTAMDAVAADYDNLIYTEISLVEVKADDKKFPIQPHPDHPVTVILPYPAGTDASYTFTIVHLKTDGTTEVYSAAKGNLNNTAAGLEFEVSSFSPFGISWKTKQTPNPDPDPTPPPVYHTVTLPAVEGAVTDPIAGSYEVEAWSSFRFFLTLNEEYDQSVPVVTTDRGETIEPRRSDGAYILNYVRTPVTISIAGVQKNTDVANESITAGVKVWTDASALYIETDRVEEVRVISISGATTAVFKSPAGLNRVEVVQGVYVVKVGSAVYKVMVR